MRILCLSDLHRRKGVPGRNQMQADWLRKVCQVESPDIVLITGDIHESTWKKPYRDLADIFEETLPVVCTLGNHEFYHRTVAGTLKKYENIYRPNWFNIHYLDVIGAYNFATEDCSVRFVGNVLWYDGSMKSFAEQDMYDFVNGIWDDCKIEKFDFAKECTENRNQIEVELNKTTQADYTILCTHTVPHRRLNGHNSIPSDYSAYSGVSNYLEELSGVDYAICGHTHRRVVGVEVNRTFGINCGSGISDWDYFLLTL